MPLSSRPEFEPVQEAELPRRGKPGVLPWLRLMRLPNVFTAIADMTMGFLFVRRTIDDVAQFVSLVAASALLYTAGMVLNDVFDFDIDAEERPFRPLPSGQIALGSARLLGFILLAIGLISGWVAGLLPGAALSLPWRSGLVATALAACVLAYDGFLKKTPLGPLGMGACRLLNVLLGMSAAAVPAAGAIVLGYGPGELLAALGIGTYIVGVTWFARSEVGTSRASVLLAAMIVMIGGVALLAASVNYVPLRVNHQIYWLLLAMLMFTVLRRCAAALLDPSSAKVQTAVKHSILSLIWLDAATVVVVANPAYGIALAALLIPALLLGRWVYST